MAGQFERKTWLQSSLNRLAQLRVAERIDTEGRAFPCRVKAINGALVTVAFEMDAAPYTLPDVEIPKAESPYFRMPTQIGDRGITLPGSVYLGHIAGLGGTLPKLSHVTTDADLVFVPVSNANSPPSNQNAAIVEGPEGAIIQTTAGTASSITTNQTGTTLTFGSNTIKIDSSGITLKGAGQTVELNSTGVLVNGIPFGTHIHPGVSTGSGVTGVPEA